MLILADGGSSNSSRSHLWKWFLQTKLADKFGLTIHVSHYPPGTSKWNPIEHRLFSFISINWRGIPLETYETALHLIEDTSTETGLTVTVQLDTRYYQTGLKVDTLELESLNISYDSECGDWNYAIRPRDKEVIANVNQALKEKQIEQAMQTNRKKRKEPQKRQLKEGKEAIYWLELYKSKFPPKNLYHDVAMLILDYQPSDFGYNEKRCWSSRLISEVCKQEFQTKSGSKSQVHRILQEIDWIPK